jgi:hypothetical protein
MSNAQVIASGADERTVAQAIEANQQMMEYMDELMDTPRALDTSVTVRAHGVTMKFPNETAMAEWLSKWKEW